MPLRMPLFVAVVPPEWHMWGTTQKFSGRFARSHICTIVPPTLKIVAPPLAEAHS